MIRRSIKQRSPRIDYRHPINWDHPLANGLLAMWMCTRNRMGGASWVDLAEALPGAITSGGVGYGFQASSIGGSFGSFRCNGTSSYVNCGAPAALENISGANNTQYGPFSLAITIQTVSSNSAGFLLTKDFSTGQRGFCLGLISNKIHMEVAGSYSLNGSTALNDGKPHRLVCSFSGEPSFTQTIYVDGVQVGTQSAAAVYPNTSAHWMIGRRAYVGAESYYAGNLDAAMIWRTVLPQALVTEDWILSQRRFTGLLNGQATRSAFIGFASSSCTVSFAGVTFSLMQSSLTAATPPSSNTAIQGKAFALCSVFSTASVPSSSSGALAAIASEVDSFSITASAPANSSAALSSVGISVGNVVAVPTAPGTVLATLGASSACTVSFSVAISAAAVVWVSLERALENFLKSQIPGLSLWALRVPQAESEPVATWSMDGADHVYTLDGDTGTCTKTLNYVIYASDDLQCSLYAEAVRQLLSGFQGVINGITIRSALLDDESFEYFEPSEGSDEGIYALTLTYLVKHQLPAVNLTL